MKRREFMKKSAVGAGGVAALHMCDILDSYDAEAFSTSGGMGIEEALSIVDAGKEKNTMPAIRPGPARSAWAAARAPFPPRSARPGRS